MTAFNLASLKIWGYHISYMQRFKHSWLGKIVLECRVHKTYVLLWLYSCCSVSNDRHSKILSLCKSLESHSELWDWSISIHHILRKENFCAYILAKIWANSTNQLITFNESQLCLSYILLGDFLCVLCKDFGFFFIFLFFFSHVTKKIPKTHIWYFYFNLIYI
jgi:hypothetical protein